MDIVYNFIIYNVEIIVMMMTIHIFMIHNVISLSFCTQEITFSNQHNSLGAHVLLAHWIVHFIHYIFNYWESI